MLLAESKRILRSFIYWMILLLICIQWYKNFYGVANLEIKEANNVEEQTTQMGSGKSILQKPNENGDYEKKEDSASKIMVGAVEQLAMEYENNTYTTYPFGNYKAVVLNKQEQKKIMDILCEITGLTKEQIESLPDDYFPATNGKFVNANGYTDDGKVTDKTERFQAQVTFSEFEKLMKKVCNIVGDDSDYEMEQLDANFNGGQTYDEATQDYDNTIKKDKITGGFARYYCDILSTVICLLPMFLAVYIWLQDQKGGLRESLYVKNVSSMKIVCTRVLSMMLLILIPIILLSFEALIPLWKYGNVYSLSVDSFAFLKYIMWWLMPTLLITISLSTFITILTETPIAIGIQGLWWFLARGSMQIVGGTKWYSLVIRHNSLQEYKSFQQSIQNIWLNRIGMIVLSIILIMTSIIVLESKRRGRWDINHVNKRLVKFFKSKFQNKHMA